MELEMYLKNNIMNSKIRRKKKLSNITATLYAEAHTIVLGELNHGKKKPWPMKLH